MARIDFWYEFASTYSYPAAMVIEDRARAAGVDLRWRPFLLGPLAHKLMGWTDSVFNTVPVKGRYMWRDLERTCAALDLPFRRPTVFPHNCILAARVALLGVDAGWAPAFSRAVYRANFAEDRDIADAGVIGGLLSDLGQDPDASIARAKAPENKAALKAQGDEAERLGLFGAPSFTVGDELFWGQDRLDQAIAWAAAR